MTKRQGGYARAKEKHWGAPVPAHLKHGQDTFASRVYGCDCKACLPSGRRTRRGEGPGLTGTERSRNLRQAKRGKPVPPTVKHGIYAYAVYGCRCDPCTAANRGRSQRDRELWRDDAIGHWVDDVLRDGKETTVLHWPPVGVGMWECPDCLEKFPHREG